MWFLPDYQDDYGIVTGMNIIDNIIWLHFWEGNGQYLICNIDEQGAVVTRRFLNDAIMLGENGVVAYVVKDKTIVFWDGTDEVIYPISEATSEIRAVAELNHQIYYLDAAGSLYQLTSHKPLFVCNVQDLYAALNGYSYNQNCLYLDCVNCFYAGHALWIMVNDSNLHGNKYLLKYDGENFVEYEASAVGTIKSCWQSIDGEMFFAASGYFPVIPHGFSNGSLTIYKVDKSEAVTIQYEEEARQYKSWNGALWEYSQLNDSWIFSIKSDEEKQFYAIPNVEHSINVSWDGVYYLFEETPYIKNGRVMLSVRSIAELVNASAAWDNGVVTIQKNNDTICIDTRNSKIGKNAAWQVFAGEIDNRDGRVMISVSSIAELLSLNVTWDEATQTVLLTSNEEHSK